jgi:hypothetical protein
MGATAFTRNYTDRSNDTGYQFELHCDKCGNGYRSSFQASALGVGSKIAKGLGSLFGGSKLWGAGVAADHLKDGLRGAGCDAPRCDASRSGYPEAATAEQRSER